MGLNFCNNTGSRVWVAVMFHDDDGCGGDGGDWRTRGWWELSPGQCKTPLSIDFFGSHTFLFFAESEDGGVWEGSYEAYAYDESFDSCRGWGSTAGRLVGFRVISMDAYDVDHTVNLNG